MTVCVSPAGCDCIDTLHQGWAINFWATWETWAVFEGWTNIKSNIIQLQQTLFDELSIHKRFNVSDN